VLIMDDRVSAWLESLGLERYREVFQQNAITWDVLPELNDGDLASLGVVLGAPVTKDRQRRSSACTHRNRPGSHAIPFQPRSSGAPPIDCHVL
jgi:hypothetical protein